MRQIILNAIKAGITRLREKGGANPESLFDLLNGYVTAARTMQSRPGTKRRHVLPAGTKGMCAYANGLHVFSSEPVDMSGSGGVTCHILRNPDRPAVALAEIHFAAPFMGYLYVVAEFQPDAEQVAAGESGDVRHYWLQRVDVWEADKIYQPGDLVQPTVPNGYAYRAVRSDAPAPSWAPDVLRTVGDKIEPTTANGYRYTVVAVYGANPRSGKTEPTWPTAEGARIFEDTDTPPPTPPPSTGGSSGPGTNLPPNYGDRYDYLIP